MYYDITHKYPKPKKNQEDIDYYEHGAHFPYRHLFNKLLGLLVELDSCRFGRDNTYFQEDHSDLEGIKSRLKSHSAMNIFGKKRPVIMSSTSHSNWNWKGKLRGYMNSVDSEKSSAILSRCDSQAMMLPSIRYATSLDMKKKDSRESTVKSYGINHDASANAVANGKKKIMMIRSTLKSSSKSQMIELKKVPRLKRNFSHIMCGVTSNSTSGIKVFPKFNAEDMKKISNNNTSKGMFFGKKYTFIQAKGDNKIQLRYYPY